MLGLVLWMPVGWSMQHSTGQQFPQKSTAPFQVLLQIGSVKLMRLFYCQSVINILSKKTAGCAKTYVRSSGTGRNLLWTCKPLTWLLRETSTFLIRKNMETVENWLQITVELLLSRRNSFPGSKFELIMAESQKVLKLQSSLLVFLSKQPRKEKILDASKELNESRGDHKCPSFEQNVLDNNSWIADNQF